MDSYYKQQDVLFNEIEERFKKGESPATIVQQLNDYENDDQICLTSVAFVPKNLQELVVSKLISPLKKADPRQYFYLPESLHLTIQNIRTVDNPPQFSASDIEKSKQVFSNIVPKYPPIVFRLKGLFNLPTSLGIRAYAEKTLKDLCLELRHELASAGVPDNKTYASNKIFFGNVSISRYTTTPNAKFDDILNNFKNIDIGIFNVESVFLITTNSVCYPQKTKILAKFDLRNR